MAGIDLGRDSDVILSMQKARDPLSNMTFELLRRQQSIRGPHPIGVWVDECAEEPREKPPSLTHCLRCNVRLAERGNSRRRRSASKPNYCIGCALVTTPAEVSAALRNAARKRANEISDDYAQRSSKPRKDALDRTLDMLETLTGWTRGDLQETAKRIVSVANDSGLGSEYRRLRTFMEKRLSGKNDGETLWDEYQRESIWSILDGGILHTQAGQAWAPSRLFLDADPPSARPVFVSDYMKQWSVEMTVPVMNTDVVRKAFRLDQC